MSDEMTIEKVINYLKFMRLDAMECDDAEEATAISEMITFLKSLPTLKSSGRTVQEIREK